MLASCSQAENDLTVDDSQSALDVPLEVRPLVHHEVTVSLNDGATTRVVATPGEVNETDGLTLTWSEHEQLGVYIKKSDNSIVRAGSISSTGAAVTGSRTFTGSVSAKTDGESYIYMHPDLGSQTSIDYTTQTGTLGSTAHLSHYIPLVWREGNPKPENQGYVVHVKMQFKENPGTIKSVCLKTMADVGQDKVFQSGFSLSGDVGNVSQLTLNVNVNAALNSLNNLWEADAYMVNAHAENINVYSTKYHVEVLTANNKKYNMCQYLSFPGQQTAQNNTLSMLANGKLYNLTAQFGEPGICSTLISSTYNVNSLLGMWNQFGKPNDPCGLIYNVSNYELPTHVAEVIGTAEKQSTMMSRMLVGASSQGTPTFTNSFDKDIPDNSITITGEASEVYVTFLSEFAWSQNLLGYYHYANLPASSDAAKKNIIFANMSKNGHVPFNKNGVDGGKWINPNETTNPGQNVGNVEDAPLQDFTTVKLIYTDENGFTSTKFPVGTTIGFWMMQDPQASSIVYDSDGNVTGGYTPRQDGTLLNWGANRYFTNKSWNSNITVFVSGGLAVDGTVKPGIAIYGARDNVTNNANYAYSAMLFMVSTGKPDSMNSGTSKAFNIGTGGLVISK